MPYTTPTATQLKATYSPTFDAVDDAVVDAAIVRAGRRVDASWTEGDYQLAIMAMAAHLMTINGQGAAVAAQLAGFKSLTVGPLSLTRSEADGKEATLSSTSYGLEFLDMLRRNVPGVVAVVPR